jgi:hypothetical protein
VLGPAIVLRDPPIEQDDGVNFPVILAGGPDWRQRRFPFLKNLLLEYIS